jgi:hypothetical protein
MATARYTKVPNIPDVSEEEGSPLVAELLDICCLQQELILSLQEQIQILRDEIAILKNQKPKPKIKPSNLENRPDKKKKKQESGKRPGSSKRSKDLPIHDIINVRLDNLPEDSRFKGYVGKLPKELENSHFGSMLSSQNKQYSFICVIYIFRMNYCYALSLTETFCSVIIISLKIIKYSIVNTFLFSQDFGEHKAVLS